MGDLSVFDDDLVFQDTFAKVHSIMEMHKGQNMRIAYSGGADSDSIMWLFRYLGYNIPAVFYNTGIEYDATKKHVDYMRSQGFEIETIMPKHLIPWALKNYGYPFVSKRVSEYIHRLQRNNFNFKEHGNKTYDELVSIYPNVRGVCAWWTNSNPSDRFNIRRNKGLKEYLIENDGVPFKTSVKCCDVTKKNVMRDYSKANNIQLVITGIRKAEGGTRAMTIKNCYLPARYSPYTMYFPLFWWSNNDRKQFIEKLNIKVSDCYTVYNLPRTGCIGCPFGRKLKDELDTMKVYEPKLHRIATTIFEPVYTAQTDYKQFVKEKFPLDKNKKV